ncbi:helicase-associated domain-containing protein [Corynebacterium heidelbergense]|nr:helicase-associated domain-containing protein [Corynebacterium heidelbergense]WCZ35988.1 hypothetical protein CHEID_02105 [Corynebacterium heidelbergense]
MIQPSPTPDSVPPEDFPTYGQWLAAHEDEDLICLILRSGDHGAAASYPHAVEPEMRENLAGGSRSLRGLASIHLLLLHAAVELHGHRRPTTITQLLEVAGELLDIAGTPTSRRPSPADLLAAGAELTRRGLMYGRNLSLRSTEIPPGEYIRVPNHLADVFHPSTVELWALADAHRCPIPTGQLEHTVEGLPPRQRRMLNTLAASGGIGHSASLHPQADPDKPLPRLVRAGILDQLDDTTARLSGRVAQHLAGTVISDPGGDFRPPADLRRNPAGPGPGQEGGVVHGRASAPQTRATRAAAATAVQTILDIADAIRDVAAHPMVPLTAGGVGARDLARAARRLKVTPATVESRLTFALHGGFIAAGVPQSPGAPEVPPASKDDVVWTLTDRGARFLAAELPEQWALLLLGWQSSAHAPWAAANSGAKPLEPSLMDPVGAAGVRAALPHLAASLASDETPLDSAALWRGAPWLAHRTSRRTWRAVCEEAVQLGLCSNEPGSDEYFPTAAVRALGNHTPCRAPTASEAPPDQLAAITAALDDIMPAPVDTLIVQGDLTIMAPGRLDSATSAQLRRIADLESGGMASVWRISAQSLGSAYRAGETREGVESFFDRMVPGGLAALPQALRYLIGDAATSAPLVASPSAAENWPVIRTQSHPHDTARAKEAAAAAVENFRAAIAAQPEQDNPHPDEDGRNVSAGVSKSPGQAGTAQEPQDIMTALRLAYREGIPVAVAYADSRGTRLEAEMDLVMMNASAIVGVDRSSGASVNIHPHRVARVTVL